MAALTMASILGLGSLGLTGASTYSQYQGQRRAARGLAAQGRGAQELANTEAGFIEAQADDVLVRGNEEEGKHRTDVRRLTGSQRARLAAQGIDIGEGSAALLQGETAVLGEVDAMTIRNNARREAFGLRTQADLVRRGGANQAAGYRNEAASARNQSFSTLLTGAAQLGSMYASSRSTIPRSTTTRAPLPGQVGRTPDLTPVPRPTVTVHGAKPWWQKP